MNVRIILSATMIVVCGASFGQETSPKLSVSHDAMAGNQHSYNFEVTPGKVGYRYWLVVRNRLNENWLQVGGRFDIIPPSGTVGTITVLENDVLFPATIYVAGFNENMFGKINSLARSGTYFLSDPSTIDHISNICRTDPPTGVEIHCD